MMCNFLFSLYFSIEIKRQLFSVRQLVDMMMKCIKGFVINSYKFHDSTSFLQRGSIRKEEGCIEMK